MLPKILKKQDYIQDIQDYIYIYIYIYILFDM